MAKLVVNMNMMQTERNLVDLLRVPDPVTKDSSFVCCLELFLCILESSFLSFCHFLRPHFLSYHCLPATNQNRISSRST